MGTNAGLPMYTLTKPIPDPDDSRYERSYHSSPPILPVEPAVIDPSDVRRCRPRLPEENRQPIAPAASDRLAPARSVAALAAWQRPRPDVGIVYGEVS